MPPSGRFAFARPSNVTVRGPVATGVDVWSARKSPARSDDRAGLFALLLQQQRVHSYCTTKLSKFVYQPLVAEIVTRLHVPVQLVRIVAD